MDLSTTYLGFHLPNPLMPGASPLVDDLDVVRRLEDAGAAAIVMHSLFEEQITGEEEASRRYIDDYDDSYPEAVTYFPDRSAFALGPDHYLAQIQRIKRTVGVPVIASLNGTTPGGWIEYAKLMQRAGADAQELNVYHVATDLSETAETVEQRVLDVASLVKRSVGIPVAIKLSPFYSSLPNLVRRLDQIGIDGVVLFNRFYQPDLNLDSLEAVPTLRLSDSSELLLRLRWLAILAGRVACSLAASGGVHTSQDALKAVMAGAHGVQVVSALLRQGPAFMITLREGMERWLVEHEYDSLRQLHCSMSLDRCPDPAAFERGNYVQILQSWHGATPRRPTSEA
jgi:dihydroorotate dehydrogenase (fumarate)